MEYAVSRMGPGPGIRRDHGIAGGTPIKAELLGSVSCLIVPLRTGQSLLQIQRCKVSV